MNFYNPYYYMIPTTIAPSNIGLLGRLFGKTGVTINNILNSTQRVLNIANQTIPLVKQAKPLIGNAKTMFKVMSEFKRTENTNGVTYIKNKPDVIDENIVVNEKEGPKFFI